MKDSILLDLCVEKDGVIHSPLLLRRARGKSQRLTVSYLFISRHLVSIVLPLGVMG